MRNHNCRAVLLVTLAALALGVTALAGAPSALAVVPAFAIVDQDGNDTPDVVTVEGYSSITFSGIGSLVGGDGDDMFLISTSSTGMRIDDAAGTNTLDYSTRTTGVTVNHPGCNPGTHWWAASVAFVSCARRA